MQTENVSVLKIHKLSQEQYDRELAAGRIDESALYLTPDEETPIEIANAVLFTEQNLTEEQKAQVRSNIGAASDGSNITTIDVEYTFNGDQDDENYTWIYNGSGEKTFVKVGDLPDGEINFVGGYVNVLCPENSFLNYQFTVTEEMMQQSINFDGKDVNAINDGFIQILNCHSSKTTPHSLVAVCTKPGNYQVMVNQWYENIYFPKGIYFTDIRDLGGSHYVANFQTTVTIDNTPLPDTSIKKQINENTTKIGELTDLFNTSILYTPQNLTNEQKAQARANIGAMSQDESMPEFVDSIGECVDTTKEYVLPDGYIYRYMKEIPTITYETHDELKWEGWGGLEQSEWILTKNTNIIPVVEGDQFIYTGNGAWSVSVFWLKTSSISYENIVSTETYGEPSAPQTVTVTAPKEAKYVLFASWEYDDKETILEVIPLNISSEYSWQNTGITYSDTSNYEERISFIEQEMETLKKDIVNNVLQGKKIVYDGDSIAESRLGNVANNGGGYAKLIADITHGTYVNQAVGGGYLRSTNEQGIHSIVDNLQNLPTDGDLYCFEGGINDYWTNATLGTYSLNDFTGSVDKTTVCGALETIFRYAITNFVGKPICFVITHKVQETAYIENTNGDTFKDYRDSMVAICEKYSIPYYDAFSESGLNGWNSVQSNLYMTANISGVGDGTHPNELGYKYYYVPQLIALFKKILPID